MFRRPRQKSDKHLAWVRSLPCAICGDNTRTEAAHIRMGNLRFAKSNAGVGAKPDDAWVTPLCSTCHRDQHGVGEIYFWERNKKDPFILALALWKWSGDYEAGLTVLRNAR
jgi:hypothetical protein